MTLIYLILAIPVLILAIIVLDVLINIMILHSKGHRRIKFNGKVEKRSILRRLWIDFPKQFAIDFFEKDPNDFDYYGLHMFCGRQGSGKTIAIVQFLLRLQKQYPELKVHTNMGYKYQDDRITHWKQVVERTNGTKGCVEVIDEIQAWFSSLQSKDFPPEMLSEISQQRKQRKMLIGSAQVFSRIAKPIREQTTYVYMPKTFLGCLTIVRKTRPEFWDDENQTFKKYEGTYFFIHSKEIRDAYDTYERIGQYSQEGFKSDEIRLVSNN